MSTRNPKVLVTGATGQLGRLIVDGLLQRVSPSSVVATVRACEPGNDLTTLGVEVRVADYDRPDTLDAAFAGVDTLVFVSSNAVGQRVRQHRNVIEAATRARVGLVVYTSLLHADRSPLAMADEHRATEALLRASGLRFVLLRNGWYTENYTGAAAAAVARGAVFGSAEDGRIASAARADYAAAAVAVLTSSEAQAGRTYELAGDQPFTLTEFAAELARQSGKPVAYKNVPEPAYRDMLLTAGLPAPLVGVITDSDVGASKGGLFDDSHDLSTLIGRPTTPLAQSVGAALR